MELSFALCLLDCIRVGQIEPFKWAGSGLSRLHYQFVSARLGSGAMSVLAICVDSSTPPLPREAAFDYVYGQINKLKLFEIQMRSKEATQTGLINAK